MKFHVLPLLSIVPLFLTSCPATNPVSTMGTNAKVDRSWKVGEYHTIVAHTPKIVGYQQIPSTGVTFRDYTIQHPAGTWKVSFDQKSPLPPILITTASGKIKRLDQDWYPEEGGADAPAVYAFTKGAETLLILQGTSSLTNEETWIKYQGETVTDIRRYASKGDGMGPGMPGVEPKYKEFPPKR